MSSRLLLPLLAVALLSTACAAEVAVETPAPALTPVDLSAVARAVDAVAAEQREADRELEALLDVFRDADTTLAWVRAPTRVDAGLDGAADARQAVEDAAPGQLRAELHEVAGAVDAAREELVHALPRVDDDWTRRYLDAQDTVLVTVRDHAAAGDALAQVLEQAREIYLEALAVVVEQAGLRDRYRDAEEAVGAIEVALGERRDAVVRVRERITRHLREREAKAAEVNRATADAATIYEARPAP